MSDVGATGSSSDAQQLASEVNEQAEENLNDLYEANVVLDAHQQVADQFPPRLSQLGGGAVEGQLSGDITADARVLANASELDVDDVSAGLRMFRDAGIDWSEGISGFDSDMIAKLIKDMTSQGKISAALAKKIDELVQFIADNTSRG